jgi:hypothetical protein
MWISLPLTGFGGKRAEKKHYCTDKSMKTRDANFRNYIILLWGEYSVKRLTAQNIEKGLAGLAPPFSKKLLAGSTINRIVSVLSNFYSYMVGEGVARSNPAREVERGAIFPGKDRGILYLTHRAQFYNLPSYSPALQDAFFFVFFDFFFKIDYPD